MAMADGNGDHSERIAAYGVRLGYTAIPLSGDVSFVLMRVRGAYDNCNHRELRPALRLGLTGHREEGK